MVVFKGKAFSYQDVYARPVVVKGFRYYCGNTQDCKMYALCSEQGRNVAERFNKLLDKTSCKIRFVVPAVTEIDQRATLTHKKKWEKEEAVVFEEKLKGVFTTFIDKRCNTSANCDLILEAFCHFSLHASGGSFVICGLKGVQTKDTSEFILTNPTIHSREGRFGPKDKRDAGIQDFSNNHTCNEFCRMFMNKSSFEFDKASDEC
ncbi:uncharacterized protein LOC123549398 isoform X2 [Mercenaria mercenaria]|uniref:uncharacterized protein LOC123549398 isoform X2 n=1 Tax=Mercenaria mercenaria TaxID=6596 RepID=UPI00234FA14C|nr:uncharacterized protein LOC123549398 isoform X2 [Mercenaria mercenaria]